MKDNVDESVNGSEPNQKRSSWIGRHRWISIGALLLLVFLAPYFYSRATSQTRLVRIVSNLEEGEKRNWIDDTGEITIAVMNIAHGRGQAKSNWDETGGPKRKRIAEISKMLKELDADVVVLNEVDFQSTWSGHQNQAAAIAEEAGYAYRMEQRNLDFRFAYGSFAFGNAVLSRFPIANSKYIEYPGFNQWEKTVCGKKGGAIATIKCTPTNFFQLYPIHTEHRDEDVRVESVDRLLKQYSEVPTVLAGDFNSTPSGFPGSQQSTLGSNAIDRILASGEFETCPNDRPAESELTFPADHPEKTIDWVFVSKHIEIVEYQVVSKYSELSDHLPILIRLRFKLD